MFKRLIIEEVDIFNKISEMNQKDSLIDPLHTTLLIYKNLNFTI